MNRGQQPCSILLLRVVNIIVEFIRTYINRFWEKLKFSVVANLGLLSIGMALGWTSPVILKLRNIEDTPLDSVINDDQESWIGSLIALGAVISIELFD